MNRSSSFILACLVTLGVAAAGCASEDARGVSEAEQNEAKVLAGEWKMYSDPDAVPNPSCDPHTRLTLVPGEVSVAHVEEGLDGFCELAVIPNPRDYVLHPAGITCGSEIWAGEIDDGVSKRSIKITDHRSRFCEDIVPAMIVYEETLETEVGPMTVTKFSFDEAPKPREAELTVEGPLLTVNAIGGETTGFGINGVDFCGTDAPCPGEGFFELILDEDEKAEFVEGRSARVRGTVKLLSGVETKDRRAIDVTDMLVCPAPGETIDCMPGADVPKACEPDNRNWIDQRCTEVEFLD